MNALYSSLQFQMNTEKERAMYKEDLKQSLIWHSNLSYDDNFLETRSGMDHRGLV